MFKYNHGVNADGIGVDSHYLVKGLVLLPVTAFVKPHHHLQTKFKSVLADKPACLSYVLGGMTSLVGFKHFIGH